MQQGSPIVGKSVAESRLQQRQSVRVFEIIRVEVALRGRRPLMYFIVSVLLIPQIWTF